MRKLLSVLILCTTTLSFADGLPLSPELSARILHLNKLATASGLPRREMNNSPLYGGIQRASRMAMKGVGESKITPVVDQAEALLQQHGLWVEPPTPAAHRRAMRDLADELAAELEERLAPERRQIKALSDVVQINAKEATGAELTAKEVRVREKALAMWALVDEITDFTKTYKGTVTSNTKKSSVRKAYRLLEKQLTVEEEE